MKHIWVLDQINCDGNNDGLWDTPPSITPSYGCDYSKNSCNGSDFIDLPDMIENYMDYTDAECLMMFTQQQCNLMMYSLMYLRSGLFQPRTNYRISRNSTFPNPANSIIYLANDELSDGRIRGFSLFDINGRTLTSGMPMKKMNLWYWDLSVLPKGIYYLETKTSRGPFIYKILKI